MMELKGGHIGTRQLNDIPSKLDRLICLDEFFSAKWYNKSDVEKNTGETYKKLVFTIICK